MVAVNRAVGSAVSADETQHFKCAGGSARYSPSRPRSFRRLAVGAGGLGPVRKLNKISQDMPSNAPGSLEPQQYAAWVTNQKRLILQSQKAVLKMRKQFQGA